MKKVICIILTLITVFSLSGIAVNAEMTTEEKLNQYIKETYHSEQPEYMYNELYTKKNAEGETAWVLIYALGGGEMPWYVCGVFNHRVVSLSEEFSLFSLGMGLYDAEEDAFYDLTQINAHVR